MCQASCLRQGLGGLHRWKTMGNEDGERWGHWEKPVGKTMVTSPQKRNVTGKMGKKGNNCGTLWEKAPGRRWENGEHGGKDGEMDEDIGAGNKDT